MTSRPVVSVYSKDTAVEIADQVTFIVTIRSQCQQYSQHQSEMMLCNLFTPTSPRTEDKLMESSDGPDRNTPPNHGVLVEPLHVFQESQDLVLTEVDKVLSVTCAEKLACSLP
jgi:hypothetical protein